MVAVQLVAHEGTPAQRALAVEALERMVETGDPLLAPMARQAIAAPVAEDALQLTGRE